MAQKTVTQIIDDLTDEVISENDNHITIHVDHGNGRVRQFDTTAENLSNVATGDENALRLADPEAGSVPQRGTRKSSRATPIRQSNRTKRVRNWARDNGYEVHERGRISSEVFDAYNKAHAA
ncbi:Lsr2 family DNA-binding protein [Corynebacterium sp. AOP12-C2-36]|uniref:Lsr2 family DNA-binding protein n=1 Tax=Corynebacterium sp. AOP12-C2-36 TaxID=3457723 RepID=UPI0040346D0E